MMLLLYNDTVSAILFNCFLPPLPPLIKIKYYATLDLYVINYFIRNKNDAKEIFRLFQVKTRKIVFSKGSRIMVAARGGGKMENRKRFFSSRKSRNETFPKSGDRVSSMVKSWNQSNLEKPGQSSTYLPLDFSILSNSFCSV